MALPKFSLPKIPPIDFSNINIPEDLRSRFISAGLLIPIVLTIVWAGGFYYDSLILVAAIIMSFEWNSLVNTPQTNPLSDKKKKIWMITGVFYVMMFSLPLLFIRDLEAGFGIIIWILLLIWATDITAYFSGKTIGGPKILPKVSPKKTWAGLIGGMIGAGFITMLAAAIATEQNLFYMFAFGSILAIIAQIGDFFESWVKRKFGVKDSGNIIPGHGGIMDRMDGFVTVGPVIAIIILIKGGVFLS